VRIVLYLGALYRGLRVPHNLDFIRLRSVTTLLLIKVHGTSNNRNFFHSHTSVETRSVVMKYT
jgi:hypothetical protein